MLKRTRIIQLAVATSAVIALSLTGGGAYASSMSDDAGSGTAPTLPSPAAADAAGYIIVYPSDAQESDQGTFYPTGEISSDTLVVIANADGSLPGGITERQLQARIAQKRSAESAPSLGANSIITPFSTGAYSASSTGWSSAYTGGSLWGWDDTARASYSFSVSSFTSQTNAGQGLGYYVGYNGSTFGTWSAWYGLTAATPNASGGGLVPWGNVVANTQFRAKCATTTLCGGYFTAP